MAIVLIKYTRTVSVGDDIATGSELRTKLIKAISNHNVIQADNMGLTMKMHYICLT